MSLQNAVVGSYVAIKRSANRAHGGFVGCPVVEYDLAKVVDVTSNILHCVDVHEGGVGLQVNKKKAWVVNDHSAVLLASDEMFVKYSLQYLEQRGWIVAKNQVFSLISEIKSELSARKIGESCMTGLAADLSFALNRLKNN